MKKIYKLLLFVVSLAGLIISGWVLYLIQLMPSERFFKLLFSPLTWSLDFVLYIYITVVSVICLLAMLAAILVPAKSELVIAKGKGKLRFSRQSVESTVRYSFEGMGGISFSKIKVKLGRTPEKMKVRVSLTLTDPSGMAGLIEAIREKIETALNASLGVAVKDIDIKVEKSGSGGVQSKALEPAEPAEATEPTESTEIAEAAEKEVRVI